MVPRRNDLIAFLFLIAAMVLVFGVRWMLSPRGPGIELVTLDGARRHISLDQMKRLPVLERQGMYQNQYGNWRDEGVYTGVRLTDLIGPNADYETLLVEAADGYTFEIDRFRAEDSEYPMFLAYAFNGAEVPGWEDGFRIVVLPEDGGVSNEEYGVPSAGSYWVRNVIKITLNPGTSLKARAGFDG